MPRTLLAAAALVFGSALVWSLGLAFDPGRFSTSAALVIAIDQLLLAVIAVAGFILARGRWARALGFTLAAFQLLLLPARPLDAWTIAAGALALSSIVVLAGPWANAWQRRRPAPDAPSPRMVVLLLGLVATPTLVGLATPSGLQFPHWVLAVLGPVLAWAFGRTYAAGLWGIRILYPAIALAAVLASPVVGAIALAAYAGTLTALSWTREATVAVTPLIPLRVPSYPIPPELVPPGVLHDAGYDERGRPVRRS